LDIYIYIFESEFSYKEFLFFTARSSVVDPYTQIFKYFLHHQFIVILLATWLSSTSIRLGRTY